MKHEIARMTKERDIAQATGYFGAAELWQAAIDHLSKFL
jgi:hypothetical protein